MPYIIKTTPSTIYAGRARNFDAFPTRRAVATLDDAFEAVASVIDAAEAARGDLPGPSRDAYMLDAANLPAGGGKLGPLPDGTVIEVEPWTEVELAAATTMTYDEMMTWPADRIIAAFNAYNERT
jgi:hypothetical protein